MNKIISFSLLLVFFSNSHSIISRNVNDNYWNILKQINDHQLEAEKIEFIESLPTEKIKIKVC